MRNNIIYLDGNLESVTSIYFDVYVDLDFVLDIAWLPNTASSRIYLTCFWCVIIVVTATYTANLVATLTGQEARVPFQTLEDVVTSKSLTLLVRQDTSHRTLLEASRFSRRLLNFLFRRGASCMEMTMKEY